MIYFTLPCFYENFKINNLLIMSLKASPEAFREKIAITACSGNFPYCSWHGEINNCLGAGAYYEDFSICYRTNMSPLRLNFANVQLEPEDFYDTMSNTILELNDNGSNIVEIANLSLMEYIQEKYPNYKFIFSKQADLITPFSPELLITLIDMNKFHLIGIPDKYYLNLEWLKSIPKRNKLEITVNPMCPNSCKHQDICHIQEHGFQLEYSEKSNLRTCKKVYSCDNQKRLITLDDIKKDYLPLGINHFTFSPYAGNEFSLMNFYINYFIKPEYHEKIFNTWLSEIERMQNNGNQRS